MNDGPCTETTVSPVSKPILQVMYLLGQQRPREVLWLPKIRLPINVEAETQIQVCLIPKTLKTLICVNFPPNSKSFPFKIMDEESA